MSNRDVYITYEYRHPDTGEVFYVGAGQKRRATYHLNEARKIMNGVVQNTGNRHKNNTIISILKLEKEPNIVIVYEGDKAGAFAEEVRLISKYGRRDNGTGCLTNLTDGGVSGVSGLKLSEERRRQISEDLKKRPPSEKAIARMNEARRGSKNTLEHIEKVRLANTGKTHTEEAKNKMRQKAIGRTHSDEVKRRISETMKARKKRR